MRLIFFIIISILGFSNDFFSQQIHIKYMYVRSPIATLYEDLYINTRNNQVISIQDSIVNFNRNMGEGNVAVVKTGNRKIKKNYFVSDINSGTERNFFYTSFVDSDDFFVYDKVPAPQWKIDNNVTKKIAGYQCYKATTVFRGSNIIAYYAKDLPYDAGPFKFYGLPGLILDVRVDNKSYDIWKAELVEINDDTKINFKPQFLNIDKISQKDFVDLKEKSVDRFQQNILGTVPEHIKSKIENKKERFGVEQRYEWEK